MLIKYIERMMKVEMKDVLITGGTRNTGFGPKLSKNFLKKMKN